MSHKPQRLPADWIPTEFTPAQVAEMRRVIDDRLAEKDYTFMARFTPVERVVYSALALVGAGVVGAFVKTVWKTGGGG